MRRVNKECWSLSLKSANHPGKFDNPGAPLNVKEGDRKINEDLFEKNEFLIKEIVIACILHSPHANI